MASKEYEQIKENIMVAMYPRSRAEFHSMVAVHEPVGDMALAFQILQDDGSCHLVTYEDLERYRITATELRQDAFKNTEDRYPASIQTLEEALGIPAERPDGVPPMYVVTNVSHDYGAAALLYPGMMERLSEMTGGDYAIIPSSIHEMMVVTTKDADLLKLENLLHKVNREEVAPKDRLSNNVYCYDAKANIVMKAAVYMQLQKRDSAVREPADKYGTARDSVLKALQNTGSEKTVYSPDATRLLKPRKSKEEAL